MEKTKNQNVISGSHDYNEENVQGKKIIGLVTGYLIYEQITNRYSTSTYFFPLPGKGIPDSCIKLVTISKCVNAFLLESY